RNPYASEGDINVGAVVLVNIRDISDMTFTISMNDRSDAAVSSNPDMTITGFLPKVSADKKIRSDDSTKFSGKGKMTLSVATRVLEKVGPLWSVAGSRTYSFNNAATIITVTGLVDPALVKGRSVNSNNVADLTMEIRGVKRGIAIQRPPVKEGETAKIELTEQEKQGIIIDYLQKMLGELTR
ncbi:MAG: hypothetical protein E4G96_08855, partial [Chrysiogenales bacterium]